MDAFPTSFTLAKAARKRRRKRSGGNRPPTAREGNEHLLSPTQKRGLRWEEKAADFLQQQGLAILARNLRCKAGEVDLIALEPEGTLVFVEVRQRMSGTFGRAADTVTNAKQQRIVRTARYLLPMITARFLRGKTPRCRFDVMGYDGPELTWLKAAFHE